MESATRDGLESGELISVPKAFGGEFCRFRKGEKVLVRPDEYRGEGYYIVERKTWRGSLVPLCNVLTCVPAEKLFPDDGKDR